MLGHSVKHKLSPDVVIVGGGVIGLTIARALMKRGLRDVVLIERGKMGAEASWAAGGILAPQVEADKADDFFRLACSSRDLYPSFDDCLKQQTGIDIQLDRTGTIYLAFTETDEDGLRRCFEWQRSEGFSVGCLSGDDARRLEPHISSQVRCALRFPNDWQVENRRLVEALVRANEMLGAKLITECEVHRVRIQRGSVTGVETSSGVIDAPVVVLAAGAWTSMIGAAGAVLPNIGAKPVRGQMLCFKTQSPIARHVLYSSSGYLIPRNDGRILAGSTSEHAGFDKRVTNQGVETITSMAREIIPDVQHLALIDSWAGFRPRAKDGLPVIGACHGIKGLIYATGHFRNGILLAPITGELIADSIVSGTTPSPLIPFSPNRFTDF